MSDPCAGLKFRVESAQNPLGIFMQECGRCYQGKGFCCTSIMSMLWFCSGSLTFMSYSVHAQEIQFSGLGFSFWIGAYSENS